MKSGFASLTTDSFQSKDGFKFLCMHQVWWSIRFPGASTGFLYSRVLAISHLHDPVDSQDQREVMCAQPNGLQDNGDGEDPSSWHTCCSDTGRRGSHPGVQQSEVSLEQSVEGARRITEHCMTCKQQPPTLGAQEMVHSASALRPHIPQFRVHHQTNHRSETLKTDCLY